MYMLEMHEDKTECHRMWHLIWVYTDCIKTLISTKQDNNTGIFLAQSYYGPMKWGNDPCPIQIHVKKRILMGLFQILMGPQNAASDLGLH